MTEWIIGRNAIIETIQACKRPAHRLLISKGVKIDGRLSYIKALCAEHNIPTSEVPRQQLDNIGDGNQGVALKVNGYPYSDLENILASAERRHEPAFILILDTLQDPQNMGSLLRTAEAVGVHGIIIPLRRTAKVTPAVVKASSGATEFLQIAAMNLNHAITNIKSRGVWVIGMDCEGETNAVDADNLRQPVALVVGSEGKGLRPLVRKSCDLLWELPMKGHIASLNAAVAGSIALFLTWQARGFS